MQCYKNENEPLINAAYCTEYELLDKHLDLKSIQNWDMNWKTD